MTKVHFSIKYGRKTVSNKSCDVYIHQIFCRLHRVPRAAAGTPVPYRLIPFVALDIFLMLGKNYVTDENHHYEVNYSTSLHGVHYSEENTLVFELSLLDKELTYGKFFTPIASRVGKFVKKFWRRREIKILTRLICINRIIQNQS